MPASQLLRKKEKSRWKTGIQPAPKVTSHIQSDSRTEQQQQDVSRCAVKERSGVQRASDWELGNSGERRRGTQ